MIAGKSCWRRVARPRFEVGTRLEVGGRSQFTAHEYMMHTPRLAFPIIKKLKIQPQAEFENKDTKSELTVRMFAPTRVAREATLGRKMQTFAYV